MLKSFIDAFNNFIVNRTEEVNSTVTMKNPEYSALSRQSSDVYNKILNNLPRRCKCLIKLYESIEASLQGISEVYIYIQGLKDGMELQGMLNEGEKKPDRLIRELRDMVSNYD